MDGRRHGEPPKGFVIVSGMPGAGKSTLAFKLSHQLGNFPVIDKDDIFENLYGTKTSFDAARRSDVSRAADSLMRREAEASLRAILVSHWRRTEISATSGTPIEWLFDLPNAVEIYCSCDPEIAVSRFLSRHRLGAHGDQLVNRDRLRIQLRSIQELGPIGFPSLLVVDTSREVDLPAIVDELVSIWRNPQF